MQRLKVKKLPKPANRTVITCTDVNTCVKGVVVSKNETQLVVDLPTGFQMTLERTKGRKLYVYRVGTLEFVSDGWVST
jgi:hypothetical protein